MHNPKVLDDSKGADSENPMFLDDSYVDSQSFIETDPRWVQHLDSEGDPIYTLDTLVDPNHMHISVDVLCLQKAIVWKNGLIALVHLQVCLWSFD